MANGLPAVLGLVSFRLLSSVLGVEIFGEYVLMFAAFGIFTQIRSGIITAAFTKLTAGTSSYDNMITASWYLSILISLIGALIAVIIGLIWTDLQSSVGVLVLMSLVTIPTFIGANLASTLGAFQRIAVMRLLETGIFLALIYTLVQASSGVAQVLLYYSLAAASVGAVVIALGWAPMSLLQIKTLRNDLKAIWDFGKFSSGTQLVTSLLTNTDLFIINYFLGPQAIALFEYGRKWLEVFEVPFRALAGVYFTAVSKLVNTGEKHKVWHFILARSKRTSLASLCALPFMFFLAPWMIELLSGEVHAQSVLVFRILMFLVLFIPFDRFLGLSLDVIGYPNLNFIKGLILLGTNFILDVVALKLGLGIVGVAAVSIIFYGLGTMLAFYWLRRKLA